MRRRRQGAAGRSEGASERSAPHALYCIPKALGSTEARGIGSVWRLGFASAGGRPPAAAAPVPPCLCLGRGAPLLSVRPVYPPVRLPARASALVPSPAVRHALLCSCDLGRGCHSSASADSCLTIILRSQHWPTTRSFLSFDRRSSPPHLGINHFYSPQILLGSDTRREVRRAYTQAHKHTPAPTRSLDTPIPPPLSTHPLLLPSPLPSVRSLSSQGPLSLSRHFKECWHLVHSTLAGQLRQPLFLPGSIYH